MEPIDGEVKVCLVSGGTRGLGSALVDALLSAGCSVATYGRAESPSLVETRARYGADRLCFAAVDAADPEQLSAFVAMVAARFGRLDALINNAAILVEGVLTLTRVVEIQRAITVNLESAILLAQAAAKIMLRQRRGSIINISSVNGQRGHRGTAVYSATKAGLDGFTRSLARELGGRGIRVNSIAPGHLATDMTEKMSAEQRAQIIRRTPLGRLGTVEDIIGVVRFLLSPASSFMTGQTLIVDGGLTC